MMSAQFGTTRSSLIAYHKFVKTTPKPNATKNSRGELVGPPPPFWFAGVEDIVGGEVVDAGTGVEVEVADCEITPLRPSSCLATT